MLPSNAHLEMCVSLYDIKYKSRIGRRKCAKINCAMLFDYTFNGKLQVWKERTFFDRNVLPFGVSYLRNAIAEQFMHVEKRLTFCLS